LKTCGAARLREILAGKTRCDQIDCGRKIAEAADILFVFNVPEMCLQNGS
jgi:hypothetical protein